MATRASRSDADSLDFQPRRPEDFDENTWELVCKTPCSVQLLVWVSSRLVGQDATNICSLLSVHCHAPCESTKEIIYQRILLAWHENRKRRTYFSELISPLSRLVIPALKVTEVKKIAKDLYDQGDSFEDAENNDSPPPVNRNNSNSSSGSLKVFGELSHESAPVDCTEIVDTFSPGIEERRQSIHSQLVTGAEVFNLPSDESDPADVNFRELREEINRLQRRFASLLQLVYKMLDRDESLKSFGDLRVFLTQRCTDEYGQIPQFSCIMLDILTKATVEEIFFHLSQAGAWNFLSYFLLDELLEEFDLHSDNQNFKMNLSSFKEAVDTFKQNTVLMDFLRVWSGRCADEQVFPGYRSVIAKSIADPTSFTIADACEMAGLLAGQFNLKPVALELSNGCRGSVYIAWRAPAAATRSMLKKMMSKEGTCRPDLLQFGIVELAIERKIFKLVPSYESIHKLSVSNPRVFWGGVGAKELKWRMRSREVFHMDKETGEFHWFRGAQVNVSENCLDVHVQSHPDKVALIWERDDEKTEQMTYKELLEATCRVSNLLKKRGVKKGDVVIIYMPTMPLAVASMLACARIGAIHCVIFSDFNAKVLGQRLREVKAKAIITTDVRVVGGQCKSLKKKVMEALNTSTEGEHEVKFVLVARRQDDETADLLKEECDGSGDGTDFYYSMEKEMEAVPPQCDPEAMDGEAILFIAYTSGTQMGTSKAVYHTQAGYLLYTKVTFKFMFAPDPEDIMGCVSDLGWIAAHSYVVYGPLSNGMTTLLFESTATYPDNDRYWRVVDKLKLTHLYTVPSVLKELRRSEVAGSEVAGTCNLDGHCLKSLKVIASGGEPMPLDIQQWYYSKIGKENCIFLDTWGQTELGGTGIVRWDAPEEKMRANFPPSKSFALYGVDLHLPDIATTLNDEQTSELYLKQPLPSMGKYVVINGKEKMAYEAEHYVKEKSCYSTSDLIMVDKTTNLFRVTGRTDRAIWINEGVWLAIPELEDSLRASHAGTEVFDAQVVSYENKCQDNSRLCAVLRTSSKIHSSMKKYWAFYAVSTMASLVSQKLVEASKKFECASLVSQKLVEASKKFEYIVYFLQMSTAESAQKCFQTVSGKTCTRALKNYIYNEQLLSQGSSCAEASRKPLDIDEKDLLQFCHT